MGQGFSKSKSKYNVNHNSNSLTLSNEKPPLTFNEKPPVYSQHPEINDININKIVIKLFNFIKYNDILIYEILEFLDEKYYVIDKICILPIQLLDYEFYNDLHNVHICVFIKNKMYQKFKQIYDYTDYMFELEYIKHHGLKDIIFKNLIEYFKQSDYYKHNFSDYPYIVENGRIYIIPKNKKYNLKIN